MCKEGEIVFFLVKKCGESPLLGLAKKQSLHSSFCFPQDSFPREHHAFHRLFQVPFTPETPFYLLFPFLAVKSLCDKFKGQCGKGRAPLDLPNLSLWNPGSFAQIFITPCQPGFTSGMSESFLGYENPSLKRTKQKGREKESSLSSRNYPSKPGWRLRYVI